MSSKTYQVVLKPVDVTEPGNLQFLSSLSDDYSTEYIDTDENGNEVHEVSIREDQGDWLESKLDQTVWVKEE